MKADWSEFWKRKPLRSLALLKLYEQIRYKTYKRLLSSLSFHDFADLGGGSGYTAKLLSEQFGVKGVVVDNNKEAHLVYKNIGKSNKTRYVRKDLFAYNKKHDLIISDGLIEHFSAKERQHLLQHHKNLARKYVLIFVPKKSWLIETFFSFKHGYEKHYTRKELITEITKAGLIPIQIREDFHMYGVLARG